MEDNKLTTEELLTLEDRSGEGVHVRPNAYAEFETSIDCALEVLVARWLPYASPRAQGRNAGGWRR
jgi:hypothetical protein